MNHRAIIAQCIRRCMRARDGRGPWQAERVLALAITRLGGDARIAADTAAAARRIGEWLRGCGDVK
jgi:hypothetical protein